MEEAARLQEQESERRLQESLRLQEQRAAAALREAVGRMERRLQERDAAARALAERVLRLEARVAALESGGQSALSRLERRTGRLEEAVLRALATVFPRVEALLAQLEKPPGAPSTAASALVGQEDDRQRMERRVLEMNRRKEIAEAAYSILGEDLCEAAFKGTLQDVRRCLHAGADVNYVSRHGATPLISAFYRDFDFGRADSDVVLLLLERGADVNAIDTSGSTALHYAVFLDSGAWVSLLLCAGAHVNARDEFGATPLHRAAGYGYPEAVRALVAAGADKGLRCWTGGWIQKTAFEVAETAAIRHLLRS
ncbi:hypothetical protein R5R35_007517 [Gryllus longicercus]